MNDMNDAQQASKRNPAKDSLWQKTSYTNLYRYVPSGKLFAHFKVKGKLVRKSLKTKSLTVAKTRLSDLEKEERQLADHATAFAQGKMTFGNALETYRTRFQADASLKPRTKTHKEERIAALLRTWKGLEALDMRKITKTDCVNWATGWKTSAINLNKTVQVLRGIFEIAIESGVRYDNPAKAIKTLKIRQQPLQLPTRAQFQAIIQHIRKVNKRYSNQAADLAEFLAYGGFRKGEAMNVCWRDCDFIRKQILVRGDAITGTKNWTVRTVPMVSAMVKLLELLKTARPDAKPEDRVMTVSECRGALATACKALGVPVLTHHDMRHLFITTCIESGVDIPTIARWAGHKDGGALAMRVYGHLRPEHSQDKAQLVNF